MVDLEKNKRIGDARRATAVRRKTMSCKTFKFKINQSSLTSTQKESLKMLFVEVKWIYNYILSHNDNIFDIGRKYKELINITHLDKDKNEVNVTISHVGSSIKQEMVQRICNEIKALSASKKKGHIVGTLRFKTEINSIPLKQYGNTHSIRGSRIKIQGIKQPIRVCGLKQLSKYETIEYATANIICDGNDYYIALTCYVDKEENKTEYKNQIIGLDFGIKTSITTSNGDKYNVKIKESERLKRLQSKLTKQEKRSNNWYKTRSLIRKEYTHICNQKTDIANKLVHKLLSENELIVMQDEQLSEWHKTDNTNIKTSYGVQYSILGRVKSKLVQSDRVIVLNKWMPTTKLCPICGEKTNISLDERIFTCYNCGYTKDRDIHAANNMIYLYLHYKDTVGTTDTSKPAVMNFKKKICCGAQENTTSLALC